MFLKIEFIEIRLHSPSPHSSSGHGQQIQTWCVWVGHDALNMWQATNVLRLHVTMCDTPIMRVPGSNHEAQVEVYKKWSQYGFAISRILDYQLQKGNKLTEACKKDAKRQNSK